MSLSPPSIENLRCFLAAAEALNFRRAARTVALTPAAFGQRIRALEDELGTTLFERTTRTVALTASGRRLVPLARDAVAAAARCRAATLDDTSLPFRLVLGTRFELGVSWLVPAVAALRKDRPAWTLELRFGSGREVVDLLERSEVDAIVTSAPLARAEWRAEPLHDEQYVFVGAPALLDELPLHTVADAARHTLIDIDRAMPLARYLASVVPALRFGEVLAMGTGEAVLRLVELGQGVAVLPHYMVADHLSRGSLRALLPDHTALTDTFRLIFRADAAVVPVLAALAAWLRTFPLR